MQGKPKPKKGRGVASAFVPAARDVTDVDPLRQKHADDSDDALIAKSDSAMEANDMLIPGGLYLDARRRELDRKPVVSTMDSHGVQDIVRELSAHPTPGEAQSEFQRLGGSNWNPSDPNSADNPDVAKALRAEDLARKRRIR